MRLQKRPSRCLPLEGDKKLPQKCSLKIEYASSDTLPAKRAVIVGAPRLHLKPDGRAIKLIRRKSGATDGGHDLYREQ